MFRTFNKLIRQEKQSLIDALLMLFLPMIGFGIVFAMYMFGIEISQTMWVNIACVAIFGAAAGQVLPKLFKPVITDICKWLKQ
ncbi:MAG: hypothetical protein J6W29_00775 [Neisseriaceae bacterium]|nr:hypothetical protein [Neisseriaceae bacterium]